MSGLPPGAARKEAENKRRSELKRVLFSLMTLAVVVGLVGAGAFAYFSDTETSTANTFTAGTLDLKVDIDPSSSTNFVDDPYVDFSTAIGTAASNLKPGDSQSFSIGVQNNGSIDGIPTLTFINMANDDNFLIEPEKAVDSTGGDASGIGGGDLGANIDVTITYGTQVYTGKLNAFNDVVRVGELLPAHSASQWNVTMSIDKVVGNIIQSDSVKFQIVFGLYQDNAEALAGTTPY